MELQAIQLCGQAGRGSPVSLPVLSASVQAAAAEIDKLPLATLVADEGKGID